MTWNSDTRSASGTLFVDKIDPVMPAGSGVAAEEELQLDLIGALVENEVPPNDSPA